MKKKQEIEINKVYQEHVLDFLARVPDEPFHVILLECQVATRSSRRANIEVRPRNSRLANTLGVSGSRIGNSIGCLPNTASMDDPQARSQKRSARLMATSSTGSGSTRFQDARLPKPERSNIGDCLARPTECMVGLAPWPPVGKAASRQSVRNSTKAMNGKRLAVLSGNVTINNASVVRRLLPKRNFTFITSFHSPSSGYVPIQQI